jgi:hypothetical protein
MKGTGCQENLRAEMRIILKRISNIYKGVHWPDLPQDRDKWRAAVNTAMNRRVAQNSGNILTS